MARLYANENFRFPVVRELRNLGHDVVTIQETGRGGESVPDDEVLRMASDDGRSVITLNRFDFIKLHGQVPDHCGIIVCTVDPDAFAQAQRIHSAIEHTTTLVGKLLRVNRPPG